MSGAPTGENGSRVGQNVLGRYRLLRFLGAGGMGEVYEGEHLAVGKRVAIKCLWPSYAADAEQLQRFEREARVASMVKSPHVVDVLDAGTLEDGPPCIVMELLEGTTLASELSTLGHFDVARSVGIARQLATGLAAAHAAGIVHRDLKPENVFLVSDPALGVGGRVKILDFGVSKFRREDVPNDALTRTGTAIGTPSYMSPEQCEGMRHVDARADVWSLGVILFRMLTGELPFVADNFARLLVKIVSDDPAPRVRARKPDVPRELEAVVARCLEKPLAQRYASMSELLGALPSDAASPPAITRPAKRRGPSQPATPKEDSSTRHRTDPVSASNDPTRFAPLRPAPAPAPAPARRSAFPPPATVAPSGLPFDEVVLTENGRTQYMTPHAFFSLPLSVRIRHVIARTVQFLKDGIEVDRQDALAKLRERYAS